MSKDFVIKFLPLTAAVSPPFIPSTLDSLRKEYQSAPSSESAIVDHSSSSNNSSPNNNNTNNAIIDPIAAAFTQEKDRALSDISDLSMTDSFFVNGPDALPLTHELHTRADSSTA